MEKQFVYFYFMKDEPARIREAIPLHISYWHGLKLEGYCGGPFADRTGGLIVFQVKEPGQAAKIISGDPFVTRNLIDRKWLKEWVAE